MDLSPWIGQRHVLLGVEPSLGAPNLTPMKSYIFELIPYTCVYVNIVPGSPLSANDGLVGRNGWASQRINSGIDGLFMIFCLMCISGFIFSNCLISMHPSLLSLWTLCICGMLLIGNGVSPALCSIYTLLTSCNESRLRSDNLFYQ